MASAQESAAPFAYDEVAYPTPILADQTPDQLGKSALMHGFRPADPRTASVLEIACGNGYNLIGVGAAAPASRCVGFDLSGSAIAVGRKLVGEAGLTNVDLHEGDILTYPHDGETLRLHHLPRGAFLGPQAGAGGADGADRRAAGAGRYRLRRL